MKKLLQCLGMSFVIFSGFSFCSEHEPLQEFYVDLHPFLDQSFENAIENIGCQPLIMDIDLKAIQEIYTAFNRGKNLAKICETTKRWAEEFIAIKEGPWADTNYRFGIFDKSGPTHKKSRLIQGINCKISREYCEWVQKNYNDELTAIPELEFLFRKLMEVESACHNALIIKIEELAKDYPQIEKIFFTHNGKKRIPISIRITRYDQTGNFCLPLHHDISVVSLILPSDDEPSEECLVIAPPKDFILNKLKRPIRPLTHPSQISAILISGALMPIVGIPIAPSPHAVLPHNRDARYVIVVCVHAPNMCSSDLNTVLNDMHNVPDDFKKKWGL